MTRSLGDMDLKAYGVSATPDTSTMAIKHGKDAFLALISDGISFVMSNQEIGNCIATCEDAGEAAQALCDQVGNAVFTESSFLCRPMTPIKSH